MVECSRGVWAHHRHSVVKNLHRTPLCNGVFYIGLAYVIVISCVVVDFRRSVSYTLRVDVNGRMVGRGA